MSIFLILVVTFIYAGVALNEALSRNFAMAVVFGGYALANIGLMAGMQWPN